MLRRIITEEIAVFMIRFIELASIAFYHNDRALAFKELNEKKIWHRFIEKFEEKRNLTPDAIADEIGEMLGMEKTQLSNVDLSSNDETEFITKVIKGLAQRYNWNYSVSFDRFYHSRICKLLADSEVGFSTFSIDEIFELFDKEVKK